MDGVRHSDSSALTVSVCCYCFHQAVYFSTFCALSALSALTMPLVSLSLRLSVSCRFRMSISRARVCHSLAMYLTATPARIQVADVCETGMALDVQRSDLFSKETGAAIPGKRPYYGASSYIRILDLLDREIGEPVTSKPSDGTHFGYSAHLGSDNQREHETQCVCEREGVRVREWQRE